MGPPGEGWGSWGDSRLPFVVFESFLPGSHVQTEATAQLRFLSDEEEEPVPGGKGPGTCRCRRRRRDTGPSALLPVGTPPTCSPHCPGGPPGAGAGLRAGQGLRWVLRPCARPITSISISRCRKNRGWSWSLSSWSCLSPCGPGGHPSPLPPGTRMRSPSPCSPRLGGTCDSDPRAGPAPAPSPHPQRSGRGR